jgi:aryl-alcohol dehydrogenase-like predicted oxidoreductase
MPADSNERPAQPERPKEGFGGGQDERREHDSQKHEEVTILRTPERAARPDRMTLGQTSLEVSPIGLGLAALGRPGYITVGHAGDLDGRTDVDAMRANAHTVLDAAYAGGVRYFDAARSYGRVEEFLGSWLNQRQLSPPAVSVGSKWGYTYTAGWRTDSEVNEVKDLSIATLRRQEQETRGQLGHRLGLYQIHSATLESGVLADPQVLEELARLRAGGLSIGFTVTGPHQGDTIARALEVAASTRSRRPGTCSSPRLGRRSPPPMTPAWA